MIADGAFLLYYDKELKQSTFIPLWETPLWFLVKEEIHLSGNIEVTGCGGSYSKRSRPGRLTCS